MQGLLAPWMDAEERLEGEVEDRNTTPRLTRPHKTGSRDKHNTKTGTKTGLGRPKRANIRMVGCCVHVCRGAARVRKRNIRIMPREDTEEGKGKRAI